MADISDFVIGKRQVIKDIQVGNIRRPRGRPSRKADIIIDSSSLPRGNNSTTKREANKADTLEVQKPSPDTQIMGLPSKTFYLCEVDAPETVQFANQLAAQVHQGIVYGFHSFPDMLLSLTQFNALRALLKNLSTLGLSIADIKEDIVSKFNNHSLNSSSVLLLPPTLRPTALQQSIIHHPWIDPFPFPSFRDALLVAEGTYNEFELCNDLIGQCGEGSTSQAGLIIWREPWDAHGWEVTEGFARKWLWLLRGCKELLESTNYWRAQRGESKLFGI